MALEERHGKQCWQVFSVAFFGYGKEKKMSLDDLNKLATKYANTAVSACSTQLTQAVMVELSGGRSSSADIVGNDVSQGGMGYSTSCLTARANLNDFKSKVKQDLIKYARDNAGSKFVNDKLDVTEQNTISSSVADTEVQRLTNILSDRFSVFIKGVGDNAQLVFSNTQISQNESLLATSLLEATGLSSAIQQLSSDIETSRRTELESGSVWSSLETLWFKLKFFIIGGIVVLVAALLAYAYLYTTVLF